MNYVIMGIDRIGKDTFIKNNLSFCKSTHLTKPPANIDPFEFSKQQYKDYFINLQTSDNCVYNRGHIDEYVYTSLYRYYSVDYINDLENEFKDKVFSTVFLLLYTDNFDILIDDGKSFDFNKKEDEQKLFIKYFIESKMYNKIMIKVNDKDKYKSYEKISDEFGKALKEIPYIKFISTPPTENIVYFK
ncbi:MAG: hypothetical protein HUJ61_06905 [Bacilli bacterium]|nr:hypothetical protein [Bacilli bacterium]